MVSMDTFRDVLRRLPKGSAPGPSGWTYEHIKAATETDVTARIAALRLVNAIVSGSLPHLPELLDCRLIGLEKPGAWHSPHRHRRGLDSPCRPLRHGVMPRRRPSLAPLQLGVGVRGGSQIIGHALSSGIAADPDCVTVQLDWRNAFNSVSRSAMLEAIGKRQPSMLPFAIWAYRQPSRLFVSGAPEGTAPIMSEQGVRQGDPLGTLYFCLTTQDQLETLSVLHPNVAPIAYTDDTFIQGSADDVADAFPALCDLAAEINLKVRLDKCAAYSTNALNAAAAAGALDIPVHLQSILAAGCPVGEDAGIMAHADAKAQAICDTIDALMDLPLPAQDKFILLKSSQQMRIAHLPRTAPWAVVGDAVQRVENRVAEAAFQIMQRPNESILRAGQLTLPLRLGGMGLRLTSERGAQAAYLSSAALAEAALSAAPQQFRPFAGPTAPKLIETWQAIHAEAAELWPPEALNADQACFTTILPGVQREFAHFEADRRSALLLELTARRCGRGPKPRPTTQLRMPQFLHLAGHAANLTGV